MWEKSEKEQARIQPQQYVDIIIEFEKIKFFSLESNFPCGIAMDLPSTTISVTTNSKNKTVEYNYYCNDIAELVSLENRIEALVNSKQWTEHLYP